MARNLEARHLGERDDQTRGPEGRQQHLRTTDAAAHRKPNKLGGEKRPVQTGPRVRSCWPDGPWIRLKRCSVLLSFPGPASSEGTLHVSGDMTTGLRRKSPEARSFQGKVPRASFCMAPPCVSPPRSSLCSYHPQSTLTGRTYPAASMPRMWLETSCPHPPEWPCGPGQQQQMLHWEAVPAEKLPLFRDQQGEDSIWIRCCKQRAARAPRPRLRRKGRRQGSASWLMNG